MLNRHLKGTVARVGIHSFGSNDKYLFSLEKKLLGWQRPDWTLVKPLKNRLSFIYSFHTCNNASWLFVPLTPCLPLWRNPQLLAPSFRDTPNSSLPFIYPMYLQHVSLTTLCLPPHLFWTLSPIGDAYWNVDSSHNCSDFMGTVAMSCSEDSVSPLRSPLLSVPLQGVFWALGDVGVRYLLKGEHLLEETLVLSTLISSESLL